MPGIQVNPYLYEVGGAAVFLEPPAARTRYPNRGIGIADAIALINPLRSMQFPNWAAPPTVSFT